MDFKNKVLMIGYGAVARATLPILLTHVNIDPASITIIDLKDKAEELDPWIHTGVRFFRVMVTAENLDQILSSYLGPGDLLIDLSINIDCQDILDWCHHHEVLYINASVEVWEPHFSGTSEFPYEKTLHYRHMKLLEQTASWDHAPTCIVDHGANPGLISHFAKKGLVDIAEQMLADGKASDPSFLRMLISQKRYAELAMEVGVKVIHCSEKDTQISRVPKHSDEFVNTWSIEGFHEEAIAPAEIGWGTHETDPPLHSYVPLDGTINELILKKMGLNTWIKSWVPNQEITGMVIRHGEAFGISDRWTVKRDETVLFRPTVSYVYRPCEETIRSIDEMRTRNYELPDTLRILDRADILSGSDILGALLMGHPYNSWWTGSILSIEKADQLVPGQNATTIQVGIGLVAAIMWMIENPREGFCLPDDLPYEYILHIARPYLGDFYSYPSDWMPVQHVPGEENEQVWQFKNFVSSYESFMDA
ncbi:MAG TPA: saccharopine dehydrogenase C-terminal domain-containing protein [Methanospirillum sp.]|nr:saccharopine dehydrogenase C-terminal domain-containing protein [Methanospirillum sp.]